MPQVSFTDFVTVARSGDALVSFPTDTVPALAVRPDRASLIFELKQRSLDKPLILMAGDIQDVWNFVGGTAAERQIWQTTAERYWPGALTLVLPSSDRTPPEMNPKDPTSIGLRVPKHPLAQEILRQTGPLATTSVNRSGQPPLLTAAAIEQQFPQIFTLLPPDLSTAPTSSSGTPSTVVQWIDEDWKILRQGAVSFTD